MMSDDYMPWRAYGCLRGERSNTVGAKNRAAVRSGVTFSQQLVALEEDVIL